MEPVAVGLSLRDAWIDAILSIEPDRARAKHLDVLEVMIDDGLDDRQRQTVWRRLGARFPLLAHGVGLGIGDAQGVDRSYVEAVGRAASYCHVRWYSEHASFLRSTGLDLAHFAPLDDDDESLAIVRDNARLVGKNVECPFLLENAADILGFSSSMGAGDDPGKRAGLRYRRVVESAASGALLDLTNLLYDARNDAFDLDRYLAEVPFERVVEVHLAGGRKAGELWIDSHDEDVDRDALALLPEVARRAPNLRAVIVERDEALPALDDMLEQLRWVHEALLDAGRRAA